MKLKIITTALLSLMVLSCTKKTDNNVTTGVTTPTTTEQVPLYTDTDKFKTGGLSYAILNSPQPATTNKSMKVTKSALLKADTPTDLDAFSVVTLVPVGPNDDYELYIGYPNSEIVEMKTKADVESEGNLVTCSLNGTSFKLNIITNEVFDNNNTKVEGLFASIDTTKLANIPKFNKQAVAVGKRKKEFLAKFNKETASISRLERSYGIFASPLGSKLFAWGNAQIPNFIEDGSSGSYLNETVSDVINFGSFPNTKLEYVTFDPNVDSENFTSIKISENVLNLYSIPIKVNSTKSNDIKCSNSSRCNITLSFKPSYGNTNSHTLTLNNSEIIAANSTFNLGGGSKVTVNQNETIKIQFTINEQASCTNPTADKLTSLGLPSASEANYSYINFNEGICEFDVIASNNSFEISNENITIYNYDDLTLISANNTPPSITFKNAQVNIRRELAQNNPLNIDFGQGTNLFNVTLILTQGELTFPSNIQVQKDVPVITESLENWSAYPNKRNSGHAALTKNGLVVWGNKNQFLIPDYAGAKQLISNGEDSFAILDKDNYVILAKGNDITKNITFTKIKKNGTDLQLAAGQKIIWNDNFYTGIAEDGQVVVWDYAGNVETSVSYPKFTANDKGEFPKIICNSDNYCSAMNSNYLYFWNLTEIKPVELKKTLKDSFFYFRPGLDYGIFVAIDNENNVTALNLKDTNLVFKPVTVCDLNAGNYKLHYLENRKVFFLKTQNNAYVFKISTEDQSISCDINLPLAPGQQTLISTKEYYKYFGFDYATSWNEEIVTLLNSDGSANMLFFNYIFKENNILSQVSKLDQNQKFIGYMKESDYKGTTYNTMPADLKIKPGSFVQNGNTIAAINAENDTLAVWGTISDGGYLPEQFAGQKVEKIIPIEGGFIAVRK